MIRLQALLLLHAIFSHVAFGDSVYEYLDKHFEGYKAGTLANLLGSLDSRSFECAEFTRELDRRYTGDPSIPRADVKFSRVDEMDLALLRQTSGESFRSESDESLEEDIFSMVLERTDFARQSRLFFVGGSPDIRIMPGGYPVIRYLDNSQNRVYLTCHEPITRVPVACGWGLNSWRAMMDECDGISSLSSSYQRIFQDLVAELLLFSTETDIPDFDLIFTKVFEEQTYSAASAFCDNLELPDSFPPGMKLKFRLPTVAELDATRREFTYQQPFGFLPRREHLWTSSYGGFLWLGDVAYSPYDEEEIIGETGEGRRFVCVSDRPDFDQIHEMGEPE